MHHGVLYAFSRQALAKKKFPHNWFGPLFSRSEKAFNGLITLRLMEMAKDTIDDKCFRWGYLRPGSYSKLFQARKREFYAALRPCAARDWAMARRLTFAFSFFLT